MKKLFIITEWKLSSGWEKDFLERRLMSEGIHCDQMAWKYLLGQRPNQGLISRASPAEIEAGKAQLLAEISAEESPLILLLGNYLLEWLTGERSIDKWQSSVLRRGSRTLIACFPMDRVSRDLSLQVWIALCARKAAAELKSPSQEIRYDFLLNPPLEETLAYLQDRVASADIVSVDIETGRGQINTVGFAISPREAIAINVLPDRLGSASHWRLWSALRRILESDQPKILQNFIYEQQFFSRYGVRLTNVKHDTMIAQKFLWPEFEMGLDAVGRMYTEMPYWKDDGKSWNNIRDWESHYAYNCKDTVGTFQGYLGQAADLQTRGLSSLYYDYITRLFPAVAEMCSWGLPLSEVNLRKLRTEVEGEYGAALKLLRAESGAETFNARSPTQIKQFLTANPRGYALPKRYDSTTKSWKASTDEKSLKKLRMKYPEDKALPLLLKLAKLGKASSSYLNFTYDADHRMRFSLNCHGTETGRFAGHKDPWDNGVNPQTVPGGNKGINIKRIFEASPGFLFLQCDLRQAESRFVAYDSPDLALITMLEDSSRDLHKYVAAEIFTVAEAEVSKAQRQLGKKSGHGANYSMKENTFIESCIQEMDLVLSKTEANKVLEAYHRLFPGIRRWHARIRRELGQTRKLTTPLGRERYFYDRLDDDMFRQAYAYRPQSTIPDIVNHLMLFLMKSRAEGHLNFRLLLQCHDSLLLEVPETEVEVIARACLKTEDWHPKIELSGGTLIIPTECEVGRNWGEMKVWHPKQTLAVVN